MSGATSNAVASARVRGSVERANGGETQGILAGLHEPRVNLLVEGEQG